MLPSISFCSLTGYVKFSVRGPASLSSFPLYLVLVLLTVPLAVLGLLKWWRLLNFPQKQSEVPLLL